MRGTRSDGGFTLPELLIGVVVSSMLIVVASIAGVAVLRSSGSSGERLAQTHDNRMVSSYFQTDVNSMAFVTSEACGVGGTPVVNIENSVGGVVSYVRLAEADGGSVMRRECDVQGNVTAEAEIIEQSGGDVTTASCDGGPCAAGAKPDSIVLTVEDVGGYTFTLASSGRVTQAPASTIPVDEGDPIEDPTSILQPESQFLDPLWLLHGKDGALDVGDSGNLRVNGDTWVYSRSTKWLKQKKAKLTFNGALSQGPFPDPLASLQPPSQVGLPVYTDGKYHGPGVYRGKTLVIDSNVKMDAGVYILEKGISIKAKGKVSGTGVVLYNGCGLHAPTTCKPKGKVKFDKNATVQLSAPTTGPYAGVLLFQDRANRRDIKITGGDKPTTLNGIVYAPTARKISLGSKDATLSIRSVVTTRLKLSKKAIIVLG
jgi:prepilin-type N-terminal cleavage/methylation domain-containing protein